MPSATDQLKVLLPYTTHLCLSAYLHTLVSVCLYTLVSVCLHTLVCVCVFVCVSGAVMNNFITVGKYKRGYLRKKGGAFHSFGQGERGEWSSGERGERGEGEGRVVRFMFCLGFYGLCFALWIEDLGFRAWGLGFRGCKPDPSLPALHTLTLPPTPYTLHAPYTPIPDP